MPNHHFLSLEREPHVLLLQISILKPADLVEAKHYELLSNKFTSYLAVWYHKSHLAVTALNYSVINSASFLSSYFTVKKSEVECLIRLFCSLAERPSGKLADARLDCNTFRGILHNIFGMTDDTLMNRGKESQQTEMNQPKTEPTQMSFPQDWTFSQYQTRKE